jgi:cell division protein FtsQ
MRRPGWRLLAIVLAGALLGTSPTWARPLLARLDFFRLRHVEVRGAAYVEAEDLVARLRVDTTRSVWEDPAKLRRRILEHPQVRDVKVRRRLPSTLLLIVEEWLPVGLVPTRRGLQPYDSAGRALPIDPSRTPLDLPVVQSADPRLLAALGRIAIANPAFYARINSLQRDGRDAMMIQLDSIRVRAALGVSASRLADIFPVESDLARRGASLAELDLRYRDQVIARLQ